MVAPNALPPTGYPVASRVGLLCVAKLYTDIISAIHRHCCSIREDAQRVSDKHTRLRVLYVDHTALWGGGEYALAILLEKSELDLRLFVLEDGPLAERSRAAGRKTDVATSTNVIGRLKELRRTLRESDHDLLVANSLRAATFVRLVRPRRMPYLVYVRDGIGKNSLSKVKRVIAKWSLSGASHALVNSEWTQRDFVDAVPNVPSNVVFTISNVTKSDFANPQQSEQVAPLRVVFAGRMVEWKGAHLLVEALQIANEELGPGRISTVFCGAPIMGARSYFDSIRDAASQSSLDASFVGHVNVRPYLLNADVFVHASTRPEPFGQVIVQACAASLCVVAPYAGGPREILSTLPKEAFFEINNAYDLARVLIELEQDRALVAARGLMCNALGRRFSDERMLALHDEVLTLLSR